MAASRLFWMKMACHALVCRSSLTPPSHPVSCLGIPTQTQTHRHRHRHTSSPPSPPFAPLQRLVMTGRKRMGREVATCPSLCSMSCPSLMQTGRPSLRFGREPHVCLCSNSLINHLIHSFIGFNSTSPNFSFFFPSGLWYQRAPAAR